MHALFPHATYNTTVVGQHMFVKREKKEAEDVSQRKTNAQQTTPRRQPQWEIQHTWISFAYLYVNASSFATQTATKARAASALQAFIVNY